MRCFRCGISAGTGSLEGVSEAAQGAEVYMQAKAAQRADRPFGTCMIDFGCRPASIYSGLHCFSSALALLRCAVACGWLPLANLTLCGCGPDSCNFLPRKQVGAWWAMDNPCIWAGLFRHVTGELGLAAQMSEVGE